MDVTVPLTTFDEVWAYAERIPGWLKRGQARMLWDAVGRLRPGARIVEIGSHQGRSTVVLAAAARALGARVTAVDPFVEGRWFAGRQIRARFEANLAAAGLHPVVDLMVGYSTKLRRTWTEPIDLLYIDGKHDYWTFTDDLRWSDRLPPGGEILVHDCYSSVGVTLGVLVKVFWSRRYVYLDRSDSLARFVVRPPGPADRIRVLRQLPWFLRNLVIKIGLRLWPGRAITILGHPGPYDPY
jgi:hypothetical protein